MTERRNITDERGVRQLADDLRGERAIALDTEFLTERTYYPRLCLIQVGTPTLQATVDPLACEDLSALAEVLRGPVTLVVHAGGQDLPILRRHLGDIPDTVFDTQIAAAFLGHGHSVGYSRLVEAVCGVQLKRSRAYTDWSRRPLDHDQLEYALDDVLYLLDIYAGFTTRLEELGRSEWAAQEFEVARQTALREVDPRQQWRRLSGLRSAGRRELGVLRELAAWREDEARRRDIPRQRVIADRVLLEVGRRQPRSIADMDGMRGFHPREQKRSGEALVAAVKAGLEAPDDSLPSSRRRSRLADEPLVAVAASLADTYLKTRTRSMDLAPQLLANRKDLEAIVRGLAEQGPAFADNQDEAGGIRLMRGWRREVVGNDILRLLAGDIGLRVVVRKGSLDFAIED